MIAVFIVWMFSAILTAAGAFELGHRARTDNRLSVLEKVPWFRVPYPGLSLPLSGRANFVMFYAFNVSLVAELFFASNIHLRLNCSHSMSAT